MHAKESGIATVSAASPWSGGLRLGVAVAAVLVLLSGGYSPFEGVLVYPALGATALYGVVLLVARPETLLRREAVARVVPDAVLISVLVVGTGGGTSMFFALYMLSALELVRVRAPERAALGGATLVAGYLAAVVAVAGTEALASPAVLWRAGALVLFCVLAGVLGVRFGGLLERAARVSSQLAAEVERAEKAEGIVSGLGPALSFSSVEGTLSWATEAARAATGAAYAHAAAIDGHQHHTVCSGEALVYPTWWHPEIQRLLLWSCREGKTVRSDGQVHGIGSFQAVPIGPVEDEWWGALIVGGEELGDAEEHAMRLVAGTTASALRGVREAPAGRDQVSGLPNRASLERVLARELSQGRSLTLFIADVAPLRHRLRGRGFEAADAMLRSVSEGLADARYRVFRYGRDEFAIVTSGTGESRARRTAAIIRQLLLNEAGRYGDSDAAVGFAFSETEDKDPERLIHVANRALAEARRQVTGIAGPGTLVASRENSVVADTVRAITEALEHRDPHIKEHLEAVARISRAVGVRISLPEPELSALVTGALLHDVGKIVVPDSILQKTGPLTSEEYEAIKRHPALGASMISLVRELAAAVPVVRHHHERFDGYGYPDGLRGSDIPMIARIVAVADAFDTMIRGRPYERAIPHEVAIQEIRSNAGTQFDPLVVEALIEILDEFDGRSASSTG